MNTVKESNKKESVLTIGEKSQLSRSVKTTCIALTGLAALGIATGLGIRYFTRITPKQMEKIYQNAIFPLGNVQARVEARGINLKKIKNKQIAKYLQEKSASFVEKIPNEMFEKIFQCKRLKDAIAFIDGIVLK